MMDFDRGSQLIDAIPEGDGDVGNLRELLSCPREEDKANSVAIINFLLYMAAGRDCPQACRLVCERRLFAGLMDVYSAAKMPANQYSPLHLAAERGHVKVVRVLKEYNFNINQQDRSCRTPLYYARGNPETCRFLLENGADPNEGGLYKCVLEGNTEVTRLLLNHGADPTRIGYDEYRNTPIADLAIENGNTELLSMLIQHRAIVGDAASRQQDDFDLSDPPATSLNYLLWSNIHNHEVKLSVCRILVNCSKTDTSIGAYIDRALINRIENCKLFLEAGMDPHSILWWGGILYAINEGKKSVCRLLVNNGIDPFLLQKQYSEYDYNEYALCPLHNAARKTRRKHVRILEYFLKIWQERFSSSAAARAGYGKHSNGDYLIHFLCRDKYVSLKAIKLVVEDKRYGQVDNLMKTNISDGFRPFLVAAMSDASLDVIYYLLKIHPIAALGQVL